MVILILIALSIGPPIALAYYVYNKDIHEKEPIGLVVKSFAFGALSIIPVLIIEVMVSTRFENNIFLYALIGVALVEEGIKFLFLKRFFFSNPEFNEPFDGIVYAVMVSLGFATIENIFYVFGSYEEGVSVGIMRMFTAVPLHAACGVIMGYFVGLAKFKFADQQRGLLFIGLSLAVIVHGIYDYFIFAENFLIFSIITLIIAIVFSNKAIKLHQDNSPFRKK